jgi:ribosome-associated protein
LSYARVVADDDLVVQPSLTIPAAHLSWKAVRASGPGGQNVNKVSSKVDLRLDFEACDALSDIKKVRLRDFARNRLDADGRIQIVSQVTRDQVRNLADARERLASIIRAALTPRKARRATKPSRAAKRRRLEDKRRQSEKKQRRGDRDF